MLRRSFLISTLIAALSTGIIRSAQPSIAIAVSTTKDKVKAGSELTLKIGVTNIAGKEIHLPYDKSHKAELNQYQFDIARSDGQLVSIMKYYWELTGEKAPRENVKDIAKTFIIAHDHGSVPLSPGKTLEYRTVLNDLYDMSQPGEYTIQVEKLDPITSTIVKSNIITVIVTD